MNGEEGSGIFIHSWIASNTDEAMKQAPINEHVLNAVRITNSLGFRLERNNQFVKQQANNKSIN